MRVMGTSHPKNPLQPPSTLSSAFVRGLEMHRIVWFEVSTITTVVDFPEVYLPHMEVPVLG